MNIEAFRDFCLLLKGATEEFPFDNRTLVFKVQNKIFASLDLESFKQINLKCDPEKAIELREQFEGIIPGYHMNKKHWNSVKTPSDVSDSLVKELTNHSYELVVSGLTKKLREELNSL
ncbi:MAG TPA: MmcQ-like protein [Flavobacteriales bacterium]|nr:MmcQ-like protein [Flavobacteriales bacterium]